MQYTEKKNCCENEKFHWKKFDIFLIFAQNIDLCFRAKIRKIGTCIPLQTPVLLYTSGVQGVFIARTCFPDGKVEIQCILNERTRLPQQYGTRFTKIGKRLRKLC